LTSEYAPSSTIGLPLKQWKERGVPSGAIIRIALIEPKKVFS